MKILALVFSLFSTFCYGQKVERSVVASAGGSFKTSSLILAYTIGESDIGFGKSATSSFLQGYNQPDKLSGVGFATINGLGLKLFPNPAQNQITLAADFQITELTVYNPQGQLIFSQMGNGNATQVLDISMLPAGVYFIECLSQRGISTLRFVKN